MEQVRCILDGNLVLLSNIVSVISYLLIQSSSLKFGPDVDPSCEPPSLAQGQTLMETRARLRAILNYRP